jgi:hypothetical protein
MQNDDPILISTKRALWLRSKRQAKRVYPLPESQALPSAGGFDEYFLSGTRQRRICRVPCSVNLGSRQRSPLPSAEHSAQDALGNDKFAEGQTLGKGGSRQSAVSLCREPTAGTRQRGFFAECHIVGTRQSVLCRVSSLNTRQSIFLFFYFVSQNFCGMFLHYVDLHVSFVDNFNRVFNR